MTQQTYARIESGTVVELLKTDADITKLFHAQLHWVAVTDPAVKVGWTQAGQGFAAPAPTGAAATAGAIQPTLATLQAQLNLLAAQIAAWQASGAH